MDTSSKLIPLIARTSLEVLESGVHRVRGILIRAVVVILVDVSMDSALLLVAFREGGVVSTDLSFDGCLICFANLRTKFDVLKLNISIKHLTFIE